MKRLVFNKWYWWISNDPSIWWVGSYYNMENVDITRDLKYIQLSKSYNWEHYLNTRWNWYIIASLYENNINYLELSYDWYLSWISNNDSNAWYVIQWELWFGRNIWKITVWNWQSYWFLLTWNYFTKWIYEPNNYDLWYYALSFNWINTDPNFENPWSWTIWAWWNITWWDAIHTTWNTSTLSRTMSCDNNKKYRLKVGSFCTTWTCQVKIAWNTKLTLNVNSNNIIQIISYTSSSTSETLEFVPSSDFNWTIYNCYIQEIYAISYSKYFNEKAPYNIYWNFIYVWNGNVITKIDMTTWTPIITDIFTIDKVYTIIWITRISDQFYVYASNWNNWRQYIWDWVETLPSREITWVDKPILNVANFANQDYVITWTTARQGLYLVNWYQLQPLIISDDYVNIWDRIYFTSNTINNIETIWNKLLIAWDWWIYTYWNKTPWTPNALVKSYTHNWWWLTNIFYSESLWYSIFAYFKWTMNNGNQQWVFANYRVQIYLPYWQDKEQYTSLYLNNTWWIETNPIFWDVYSNIKSTEKMTLWIKLKASTQINIYQKETEAEQYANLYLRGYNLWLQVWDLYTFSWRTFTILNIINPKPIISWYLLHCSYTWTKLTWAPEWSFTRTSWTWANPIYIYRIRYWYKLLQQFTDITKTRVSFSCPSSWNETQYAFELISNNSKNTPKLYDVNLYYDETTND